MGSEPPRHYTKPFKMRIVDPIPFCPLPGLSSCVRERGNFWSDDHQECDCDCINTCDPIDATTELDFEAPGIISLL